MKGLSPEVLEEIFQNTPLSKVYLSQLTPEDEELLNQMFTSKFSINSNITLIVLRIIYKNKKDLINKFNWSQLIGLDTNSLSNVQKELVNAAVTSKNQKLFGFLFINPLIMFYFSR
jgi:hypothetical protein